MSYRLPSDMQADLTWYFCEADADLGVCSTGNIEHRGPPVRELVDGEIGIRLTRIRTTPKDELRRARWSSRDEELRLMWQQLVCHGDSHVVSIEDPVLPDQIDRTPMPAWARRVISHDRRRAVRVHSTIRRMVERPGGPAHERVLYRVYGPHMRMPLCYGHLDAELAPLIEYTDEVAAMLSPTVTRVQAAERLLGGKSPPAARVLCIRRQADALLEAASRAYAEVHDVDKAERIERRRESFRRLMGAA